MTYVVGVVGWKNSGKTTLIERVIPLLVREGVRVSTIKHAHHTIEIDQPGKDSYRHRLAGANEVMVASEQRWALLHETRDEGTPSLDELLARLTPTDLVIVEGFKDHAYPKLVVARAGVQNEHPYPSVTRIIAITTDMTALETSLPCFSLNDVGPIAALLLGALAAQGRLSRV